MARADDGRPRRQGNRDRARDRRGVGRCHRRGARRAARRRAATARAVRDRRARRCARASRGGCGRGRSDRPRSRRGAHGVARLGRRRRHVRARCRLSARPHARRARVTRRAAGSRGRPFFSPPGRYFEGLYDGVPDERLVDEVIAEIERGARWIKIVGDFPERLEPGFRPKRTYTAATIAAACDAAHARGARVAVHCTIDNAREVVEAGVDSIEHGIGLDEATLHLMAERGTAWVPTLGGVPGPDAAPGEIRDDMRDFWERRRSTSRSRRLGASRRGGRRRCAPAVAPRGRGETLGSPPPSFPARRPQPT